MWSNRTAAPRTSEMRIIENLRSARWAKVFLLRTQRLPARKASARDKKLSRSKRQRSDQCPRHENRPAERTGGPQGSCYASSDLVCKQNELALCVVKPDSL